MVVARLKGNLKHVRERISAACERVGRDPASVRLVAVTKTVHLEEIRALYDLGVRDFGENRVTLALEKAEVFSPPDVNWHFIGHLQRNKAARLIRKFRILHSMESLRLAEVLQNSAEKQECQLDILVEVNVAGEDSKYGLAPRAVEEMITALAAYPRLCVRGLMAMAPYESDPENVRWVFRDLRELRDDLRGCVNLALPELSMGMSGDFEIAIEEGSTMVRVGSALFV